MRYRTKVSCYFRVRRSHVAVKREALLRVSLVNKESPLADTGTCRPVGHLDKPQRAVLMHSLSASARPALMSSGPTDGNETADQRCRRSGCRCTSVDAAGAERHLGHVLAALLPLLQRLLNH